MKLYMVRHGQSETNLSRHFTGWGQVSLTEQGFADARRAGKVLEGLRFDRIYSSDLIRAVQTAQTAIPGCEPVQMAQLREINVGDLMFRSIAECEQTLGEDFEKNRREHHFAPYGGEDLDMLRARVAEFFHMLEQDPCEQAVAFAHAGVLSTALEYVLGVKLDRSHVRCLNSSVAVFSYENGRWLLCSWGL